MALRSGAKMGIHKLINQPKKAMATLKETALQVLRDNKLKAVFTSADGQIFTEKSLADIHKSITGNDYEKVEDTTVVAVVADSKPDAKAIAAATKKAKADAYAQAKLEADEKAKADADAQAELEAAEKAKADADAQAKLEADEKAKAEAEATGADNSDVKVVPLKATGKGK